jgi:hypothetical protein
MLFTALVFGTALFYILQERFRQEPDTPAARVLGRSFGIKPSGPNGKYTRRERLLAALASLVGAFGTWALAAGSIWIADRIPDLTTANHTHCFLQDLERAIPR